MFSFFFRVSDLQLINFLHYCKFFLSSFHYELKINRFEKIVSLPRFEVRVAGVPQPTKFSTAIRVYNKVGVQNKFTHVTVRFFL